MDVLGVEVSDELARQWRDWLMPTEQPYLVPDGVADNLGWRADPERLTMEVKDAFWLYGVPEGQGIHWLTRPESGRLSTEVRRSQPAAHRWPTDDIASDVARTIRYVEDGRRRSRHAELASSWERIGRGLPYARDVAGTFPDRSGPNCFGTVMGAAGIVDAANAWMQREPFETWLATSTVPGGTDDRCGTVLVWRSGDGQVQHAGITLGDGYALHKPSQGWMSPTKVLTVTEVKYSARATGHRLERHRLTSVGA